VDQAGAIAALERLVETTNIAILANIDQAGRPRMRWMTPALIRGQKGSLYALTSPNFDKTVQLKENDNVEWMLQSKSLDEIMRVRGRIVLVDNPTLKADVTEALGGRLTAFWRVNPEASQLIVLETVIDTVVYYKPTSKEKHEIFFGK